jgi:FtsZ-binding cell division protein ZapB
LAHEQLEKLVHRQAEQIKALEAEVKALKEDRQTLALLEAQVSCIL